MEPVVFSDIDGTLLNSEHRMTPLTLEAVKSLKSRGIPLVLVSARSPSGIGSLFREYGFRCPFVAYNGGLLFEESGQVAFHEGLEKEEVKQLLEFVEATGFLRNWCLYSLDQWIVQKRNTPEILQEEAIVKVQSLQGTLRSVTDRLVNKIWCFCSFGKTEEIGGELQKKFPGCTVSQASEELLEIMPAGVTKGAAVQRVCEAWHIPLSSAIAFGDAYNDAEMLEAVGKGFLMGNAPRDLKERIRLHTLDSDHDGVYWALQKLGLV